MNRSLAFLMMVLSGCAVPVGGRGNDRSRADTGNIVEIGPLLDADGQSIAAGASVAYRVEGFGSTALSLAAPSAQLTVEGPLGAPEAAPGQAPVVDSANDALEVTLGAGVYRVIVSATDDATLSAACTSGCDRPSISAQDLVAQLLQSGKLQPLLAELEQKLGVLAPDPTLQSQLDQQLAQIAQGGDLSFLARYPSVQLASLGQLRPALGLLPAHDPAPDAVVSGELADLLGDCSTNAYPMPSPISNLDGVAYGHFPNRALTACQSAHSASLAQILTSLAAQNGSVVTYRGQSITTPDGLLAALLDNGHTIVARNERTYANFLSFAVDDGGQGIDSEWPVWIDSGVQLDDGSTVTVPMGHSGQAWRITGPDVDARVMFYLGISGAGFFAETDRRPAWTGLIATDETTDRAQVLAAADGAARYLRRNRVERSTVAAGLPADGYGFVGVCNDSNAVVEYLTRGTITTFPLLRAASLDQQAPLGDGLDDVMRALPHDGDQAPARADGLRRILAMMPLPLGSPLFPDDTLRAQLAEVSREVGQ